MKFCKTYHEEFGLFRLSDLGKSSPLPIYNKKRYIIIDLTKYVPQKSNSVENKWIELFRSMPEAKSVPKGIDDVLKDVYERALGSRQQLQLHGKADCGLIPTKKTPAGGQAFSVQTKPNPCRYSRPFFALFIRFFTCLLVSCGTSASFWARDLGAQSSQ